MNFPIVKEYRDDIRNVLIENEVKKEPFAVEAGKWTRIIVPVHAPFFVKSLEMFNGNMEPLVPGEDYQIYRLMSGLTELTAKPVACFIELLKEDITEGFLSYDVVGEFSLFDSAFLQLVLNAVNDDRPAWWDNLTNKPVVFRPKLHGHSLLYEVVAFTDTVKLVDGILGLLKANARSAIEVKFDHFLNLLNHYIGVYKTELINYLTRHMNAYDGHGLTKTQINLPLVDNFATARGDKILQPRRDLHLTPGGLRTILDAYGFNSEELMPVNQLPIAQFGNSNFIPPSIDGSFEGLGGMSESAGICMESDGSLVFLENRFDGRVQGLYYSVVDTPYDNPKRVYTGYRYTHQIFEADNTKPNLIAQGSGNEVILVCDSTKEKFYLGLTNGSLDSAKHVYSRLDVSNILAIMPEGYTRISSWMYNMNVVLMGDWIYVILAAHFGANKLVEYGTGMNFRYLFRVPKATVAAQNPATAVQVNVSFRDGEGMQWMNSPNWRWGTPIVHPNGAVNQYLKWYFPFVQTENLACTGVYRSQLTFATPIPTKPGKFLLRFCGAFWSRYTIPGKTTGYEIMLEMLYEFDPVTGVMTLVSQTPRHTLDFDNLPSIGPINLNALVFMDREQGAAVLPDGTIVASYGAYQSFPRGFCVWRPRDYKTQFDTMNRQWNTQLGVMDQISGPQEIIVSPLKSTVKPRSFLLGNGGDMYCAPDPDTLAYNRVYYRVGNGKLAQRSDVTNLLYPTVLSRPLSNDVREVNAPPHVGGATVTVPAAQLDAFGTDLGEFTFCVGVQKKYLDLTAARGEFFGGTNPDDVPLTTSHTRRIEADGTITMVPTTTILYPQAIVNQLKLEVEDVGKMQVCPKVFVSIVDPTGGALANKFGWLPVLVCINWAEVGTTNRRATLLSIAPTYSGTTNRVVTGFTVLDKKHVTYIGTATALTPTTWDATPNGNSPNGTHGAMRAGYHVNGNQIIGFFAPSIVAAGPGDSLDIYVLFRYDDKTTRRWRDDSTQLGLTGQSGGGGHRCIIPDDAVVIALPHASSTGGAGTMFQGATKTVLLGSVYPEVGWTIFFKSEIKAAFNGQPYTLPPGAIDLRDIDPSPANKTFYIYAVLVNGVPTYQISQDKRLESPFQLWVGKVITNNLQILTIERFNVFTVNGNRVSEIKRGNAIPASSGLANTEGQFPWLRSDELLP